MVDSDNERENGNEFEETEAEAKDSRMRGMFNRARAAATEKLEQAQEAAGPQVDRAREAAAPRVEKVQEAAAPHVERMQDIYAKGVGAEFREEFTRYVNAATTTIVGLHQDQAALRERIDQLENEVKALRQRVSDLEGRSYELDWDNDTGIILDRH